MKFEELIQASNEAFINNSEHARTNFDQILDFITANSNVYDLWRLISDIHQLGLLYMIAEAEGAEADYSNVAIMVTQCILRNKEIITKFMDAPEIEVEFI